MPSDPEIRRLVEQLRQQLAELDEVDPQMRSLLEAADGDIHAALGSQEPPPASLLARLKRAAAHFEDDHPALTATISGIAEALSRIGI